MSLLLPTLVLGIHPTAKGLGWILFENPATPLDWSILRSTNNGKCLELVDHVLARHEPSVVALEEFCGGPARRGVRIQHLCDAIMRRAQADGIQTHIYSRAAVQACFALRGRQNRHAIARVIAHRLVALRHRLPPPRRPWSSEDARQALFDAAALAITHYAQRG